MEPKLSDAVIKDEDEMKSSACETETSACENNFWSEIQKRLAKDLRARCHPLEWILIARKEKRELSTAVLGQIHFKDSAESSSVVILY